MQTDNRLFDDFVKVMNGAAGTLAGMTREARQGARERSFLGVACGHRPLGPTCGLARTLPGRWHAKDLR